MDKRNHTIGFDLIIGSDMDQSQVEKLVEKPLLKSNGQSKTLELDIRITNSPP